MHIINLVDSLDRVNYGIWNAVIANFPYFIRQGHQPEIWTPSGQEIPAELGQYEVKTIPALDVKHVLGHHYAPEDTVVISHGCWKEPTRWGLESKKQGFIWLALPHGMLEPWSMRQKWLKKKVYFHLVEERRLKKASGLIAVSRIEQANLEQLFNREVVHIPNGIVPMNNEITKPADRVNFLFMARLHHKKGIIPLLKAWTSSKLAGDPRFNLTVAGPNDGELPAIEQVLDGNDKNLKNIHLYGPLYGEAKVKALEDAHIYILPSFSEGFPTSILEAATHGCYPVFTGGCNFNEAFAAGVALQIAPEEDSIIMALNRIAGFSPGELIRKGAEAKKYVDDNYNLEMIGKSYLALFEEKLGELK